MSLLVGDLPKSETSFLLLNGWIPVQSDKWMATLKVGIYGPLDVLTHRAAVLATRNSKEESQ
jgi:hypothetical protein